jgi:hypothetical protein
LISPFNGTDYCPVLAFVVCFYIVHLPSEISRPVDRFFVCL